MRSSDDTFFFHHSQAYYAAAIRQGRILVSDNKVDDNYIIKGGDILTHTVHRHEPGVAVYSDQSPHVRIVEETDDVLVVDKPSTLPVHPCGGYHQNSLIELLQKDFGKLYTIHRLDRLTSGLVLLGKNSCVAQQWGKCIMDRGCEKVYLARVAGKFPLKCPHHLPRVSNHSATLPVNGEYTTGSEQKDPLETLRKRHALCYWITCEGNVKDSPFLVQDSSSVCDEKRCLAYNGELNINAWFHLACPTRIAKPKDGICEAGSFQDLTADAYIKTVKPAQTKFGVVRYDPATDSTVLLCKPSTGRTHQIRLHLQYLGHPIANDPNYGGDLWYGNPAGRSACDRAQEKLNLMNTMNRDDIDRLSHATTDAIGGGDKSISFNALDMPATQKEIQDHVCQAIPRKESETVHDFIRRTCVWCARSRQGLGEEAVKNRTMLEFLIRSPGIWLHALEYTFTVANGESTTFRTPLPSWANPHC